MLSTTMLNQWWSYTFNEEGNTSNTWPANGFSTFHHAKSKGSTHDFPYIQRHNFLIFGKTNTLIAACQQRHMNKMVFPHGYATTKHFPMQGIFPRSEEMSRSETEHESDVLFISAWQLYWKVAFQWKIDKVFHSRWSWRKLTLRQLRSHPAFSMAVSFQLHCDSLCTFISWEEIRV